MTFINTKFFLQNDWFCRIFYTFASVWLKAFKIMSTLRLNIVGFPYRKDIEGHVSEFLADAPGHAMTLRPHSGNDHDKNAIRAFDWQGRFVGYVSHRDLPMAWGALRSSGSKSLRGMIISTNIEHPCAVFECVAPVYDGPAETLYPQNHFLNWPYSGPILNLPDELDNLDYMMGEIGDRLAERDEWTDDDLQDFLILAERFARYSKYDISGEMNDYRRSLIIKLRDTNIEELEDVTEELERAFGRSGREAMGGEVLDFWMRQMQSSETRRQLMVHRREYDVAAIERELEWFPESMYYVWKENRELFVSKVLYMHIPREALWRLVSGIAFVEMTKPCVRCIDISAVSQVIDTVLPLDVNEMKEAELLLSRINDRHGHVYDAELERLRNARDAKVAQKAEPRRIGQVIGRQNNLGDLSGLESLLQSKEIMKLLE